MIPFTNSTAELLAARERFLSFAANLVFKADVIDLRATFAPPRRTGPQKFSHHKLTIGEARLRSRHLRDQAGEIFGRVDAINAELERREDAARPLPWLSKEAKAAIRDDALFKGGEAKISTRSIGLAA